MHSSGRTLLMLCSALPVVRAAKIIITSTSLASAFIGLHHLSWPVCLEWSNNVMVTKRPLGQRGKHELTSHLLEVFTLGAR